jgi:hypothetical protein
MPTLRSPPAPSDLRRASKYRVAEHAVALVALVGWLYVPRSGNQVMSSRMLELPHGSLEHAVAATYQFRSGPALVSRMITDFCTWPTLASHACHLSMPMAFT